MSARWYEAVPADALLDQGDLILDCPVAGWQDRPLAARAPGDAISLLRAAVEITAIDAVVITQTCDLAHRHVRMVTLCPHSPVTVYREAWDEAQRMHGQRPTERAWSKHLDMVKAGQVWNLAMLNCEDGPDYTADLRVADFHEVFTLPRDFLESWLAATGRRRIRLCPPYREHLSQAFARFFMRVGLPTDIRKAW